MTDTASLDMTEMTTGIVSAYVSSHPVTVEGMARLIEAVHASLARTAQMRIEPEAKPLEPAVPIGKSLQNDHIVCLEDGRRFRSLKRHLRIHHGLTPDEYREKWGLPPTYPMIAPDYAAARSAFAKKVGLGRKPAKPKAATPAKAKRALRKRAAKP